MKKFSGPPQPTGEKLPTSELVRQMEANPDAWRGKVVQAPRHTAKGLVETGQAEYVVWDYELNDWRTIEGED